LSTLTKVLALLVSALVIFLCGPLVTFVSSTENWRGAYEDQRMIAEAAQITAEVAHIDKRRELERNLAVIQRLRDNYLVLFEQFDQLNRELVAERLARSEAENKVSSVSALCLSIQQANRDLHEDVRSLQADLDEAFTARTKAEAERIRSSQQLTIERARIEQLDAIRLRAEEKITRLENENEQMSRRLHAARVQSKEFAAVGDHVSLTEVGPGPGLPIRGEIVQVDADSLASISVGSSSGVRKGTTFRVVRGGRFLASLKIQRVRAREAVGRLTDQQAQVVAGDVVTTFD